MNGNHPARLHVQFTVAFAVASARALARWGVIGLLAHLEVGMSPAPQLPACAARPGLSPSARAHGLHPQPLTHKEDAWENTGRRRPAGEAAR